MRYMLDTDLCIELMRGKAAAALDQLMRLEVNEAGISTITLYELCYGASKSKRPTATRTQVYSLCAPLFIAPFDSAAAEVAGELRAGLDAAGTPIGPNDILIAGHALCLGATLLTANVREFSRISGLVIENWLKRS